ncbi:MAG: LexA family transcriptional regulator [Phycisphaerae bacterium]
MCSKYSTPAVELTDRIREVRISAFGERGRAQFARALGVSPSTYNYYERGRVPPMPLLLKISEVGGVDLPWLLTGQFPEGRSGGGLSAEHARILARMSVVLPRRAEAAAALNAVIDLLESQPQAPAGTAEAPGRESPRRATPGSSSRIPVLGRTAAGVPQFWRRSQPSFDLLRSAIVGATACGDARAATLAEPDEEASADLDEHVHVVQLAKPVKVGELHITDFVDAPMLRDRWADAFALRIDGDSMYPSLSHGDLVILSPREPARPGRAAVVQLRNQIGVTCKLFYTDKTHVRLIPINERFEATRHALKELAWALAVLYRVRISV